MGQEDSFVKERKWELSLYVYLDFIGAKTPPYIIEGVLGYRVIRYGLRTNTLLADCIIYVASERLPIKKHETLRKVCNTIWRDINRYTIPCNVYKGTLTEFTNILLTNKNS